MPNPRAGEDKQAYVARFMASAEAQKDYPDEKQRAAVAYSMWGEKTNSAPCRDCGAATQPKNNALECPECGLMDRDATPPIESVRNLCPACRHQLEPGHDELGCHSPGCPCSEQFKVIVEPRDVLPNSEAMVRLPNPGDKCPNCGNGKIIEYDDKSTGCDSCNKSYHRANNSNDAERGNVARFERMCQACDAGTIQDAAGNDAKCPKCKGTGVESVDKLNATAHRFVIWQEPTPNINEPFEVRDERTDETVFEAPTEAAARAWAKQHGELVNVLDISTLRARIAEWKKYSEKPGLSDAERSQAKTIMGNFQTELDAADKKNAAPCDSCGEAKPTKNIKDGRGDSWDLCAECEKYAKDHPEDNDLIFNKAREKRNATEPWMAETCPDWDNEAPEIREQLLKRGGVSGDASVMSAQNWSALPAFARKTLFEKKIVTCENKNAESNPFTSMAERENAGAEAYGSPRY